MHSWHGPWELRKHRYARVLRFGHLLRIESARLDHACDTKDARLSIMQTMKDLVLAVGQAFSRKHFGKLRAFEFVGRSRQAQRQNFAAIRAPWCWRFTAG